MRVGSTAGIVARELDRMLAFVMSLNVLRRPYDSLEAGDTLVVRQLDATEESRVQARLAGFNTSVDTGCVAVPDVDCHGRNGLASVDIDVLYFEEKVNAF